MKQNRRRPKGEWLLSECAPFIRRILHKWATDADRTQAAHEFADWLDARGDDHAFWFRHPKLRWQKTDYGSICWNVHPWDNPGGGGCGARIDNAWWTITYPTREWIESARSEKLLRAWFQNRVEFEKYTWTREVAARIGLAAEYDKHVKERIEHRELVRKSEAEKEIRDRKTYTELRLKFESVKFRDGSGI